VKRGTRNNRRRRNSYVYISVYKRSGRKGREKYIMKGRRRRRRRRRKI
jgi:hypothetical protein